MVRPNLLFWILLLATVACGASRDRQGATVLYASGADLQSINPLFTVHPLARQVQRYVLLTTLVRRDSALAIEPYLARSWQWSPDGRTLTFRIFRGLRWHDGFPTTAHDAAWTLRAAITPTLGYPRATELATLRQVSVPDDSTLVLAFAEPPPDGVVPDVLTDLAILPAHLLDTVPVARLRQAVWHQQPVGNGPFRFRRHEANRRWVFDRNPDFPRGLGGPPAIDRLVIAVVDEPMTKLAALVSGELDVAGIQPAHAEFVRRNPALRVEDYPLLFTTSLVFNARRPPFDNRAVREAVAAGLDRQALVDGFAWGFGTVATGPVPPGVPGGPETVLPSGSPIAVIPPPVFELLTVGSGEAALEQMIQAQLARRGIEVRIRQLELAAFLDRVYGPAHDFEAAVLGVPGDLALGHLGPLVALSGLNPPGGRPELLRFFRDSLPVVPLYHARGLQGVSRRLRGTRFGLRGELANVAEWRMTP